MKKRYQRTLVLGTAVLLLGMVLGAVTGTDRLINMSLINAGLALIVISVVRGIRYGDMPERDERTKKLSAYGVSYSWFFTLVFLAVLFWVDYFNVLKLTVTQVIGVVYFVMIVTAISFQGYYKRKGDVE